MELKPHQQRVVAEQTELDLKRQKLTEFIGGDLYQSLNGVDQTLLSRQLEAMTVYSDILGERIALFA